MPPLVKDLLWIPVNIAQMLWLAAFTVFSFFPSMVATLLTGNREAGFAWGRVFWGPLNLKLGFSTLQIEGREHLPPPGSPAVVMFNHQSMIDVIVSWMVVPTGPRFVAKKTLGYIPFIGQFISLMGIVLIDRRNTKEAIAVLQRARAVVDTGRLIVCFPEGTRSPDGAIMPFKKGVFMLALETGAPIIPVALEGAATLVPLTGWKPRPATVRARVGAPISTIGIERDALIEKVRNAIIDLHLEIGGKGGDRATAIAPHRDDGHVVESPSLSL